MGDHPKSFLGTFLDLGGETYNHSTAIISSTHSPDTDTIRITKKLFDLDYHLYYSQYGFRERPSRTFKRSTTASKPARCVGPAYHGAQSPHSYFRPHIASLISCILLLLSEPAL